MCCWVGSGWTRTGTIAPWSRVASIATSVRSPIRRLSKGTPPSVVTGVSHGTGNSNGIDRARPARSTIASATCA